MIKAIVTDIEGTTSSISFVHEVLFPYARARIADFVRANEASLQDIFAEVRREAGYDGLDLEGIIEMLIGWIDADQKITPLKTLQGRIWKAGYEEGALKGHIYDDAALGLKRWKAAGFDLYVYSSGSIAAQKLLFAHTQEGDLTPLFSGYFDTTTGPKIESVSYSKIAGQIGLPLGQILFLSDSIAELDSASAAGMNVFLLDRDGKAGACDYPRVASFDEIILQEKAA